MQKTPSCSLALSSGDVIRITQNGRSQDGHRLNNGAMYQINGFTEKGDIQLNNGWVLPQHQGHLTHGYVTTSHASQGKTVDKVFIAQGASSFAATSREQFYVSASRGRERVTIYTDDKEALKDAIKRSGQRRSATELVQEGEAARRQKQAPKERSTRYGEVLARMAGLAKTYAGRMRDRVRERYGLTPEVQRVKQERGPRFAAR